MNAEVLLMFVLGCDRAYLYAHPERDLSPDEQSRYNEALEQRARGVPSQYITGHQEFWGLDFIVGPGVLIPRPETEHLVEAVLELCKQMVASPLSRPGLARQGGEVLRIVDVGTGSGCVALALASELPQAEIHATEISADALEIARANAARLALDQRVTFHHADLLQELPHPVSPNSGATRVGQPGLEGPFDVVASNPPYVGESEYDKVQLEVRKFEPRHAVFAGPEGMDVIRRLAPQARASLKPGGWLAMEIGYSQELLVRAVVRDWQEVRTVPDLQGIPRVILARK